MAKNGFLLAALALAANVAAIPTTTYPEVIPGPGLPSLASLGLASEDLYKMDYKLLLNDTSPNPTSDKRSALWTTDCNGSKCQAADAVACINYLASLGSQLCPQPAPNGDHSLLVCTSNSARIKVHQLATGADSTYNDVARGGGFVMDACTQFGLVSGDAAAFGNGNFIVDIALVGTDH